MNKKLKAVQRGHWAESISCWFLRLKGYRIIQRNLRTPMGEIDIIAVRCHVLCFIEVKARRTQRTALDALSRSQQKRIIRTAKSFLSRNQRYGDHHIRFDFIAIVPRHWPRHIKNAWTDT